MPVVVVLSEVDQLWKKWKSRSRRGMTLKMEESCFSFCFTLSLSLSLGFELSSASRPYWSPIQSIKLSSPDGSRELREAFIYCFKWKSHPFTLSPFTPSASDSLLLADCPVAPGAAAVPATCDSLALHSFLLRSTCTTRRRRWGRRNPGGSFPPTLPSPEWENSASFVCVVKLKIHVQPLTPLSHLFPPQLVVCVPLLGCELLWLARCFVGPFIFVCKRNTKYWFCQKSQHHRVLLIHSLMLLKCDVWRCFTLKATKSTREATNNYFCCRLILSCLFLFDSFWLVTAFFLIFTSILHVFNLMFLNLPTLLYSDRVFLNKSIKNNGTQTVT